MDMEIKVIGNKGEDMKAVKAMAKHLLKSLPEFNDDVDCAVTNGVNCIYISERAKLKSK